MDKLNPAFQALTLTTKTPENVGAWYVVESTAGYYTSSEMAWLTAQGWKPFFIDRTNPTAGVLYFLQRKIIKPQLVLQDLIKSYTDAYNEGRQLNEERYDDLVVLYTSLLDRTEDTFNANAALDATHETLIDSLIAAMAAAYTTYSAAITGGLDAWGASLVVEINARFDAELGRSRQGLIDRGLYTGTLWTTSSAGVERERNRALIGASDQIKQRQVELEERVYAQGDEIRTKVMVAYERLRGYLAGALDRQVTMRNMAATALGQFVERRDDTYPDLGEIGKLAASLGAGSPEAFAP